MASQEDKIYNAKQQAKTLKSGAGAAKWAAQDYVWKGLNKTGLSTDAQNKLAKKLIPVVQNQIQNDFNKTAMRAKMIESTQKRKAMRNAESSLMGGTAKKAAPKKTGK
jgi:hypothetical protein